MAAYDVDTGRELWTHGWEAHFRETMGGPGPRATPTWHEGRLYALGATGPLWCLDAATGEVLWDRNILDDGDAANLAWAMSASPLIVDEMVVVLPGGRDGWSVAAYDRLTGDIVWHVLDDIQGYTSPMLATIGGVRQILVVTADRAAGLHVDDGHVLWDYPWVVSNVPNMAQPLVIGDNQLFLSASYGKGAMLLELSRNGDSFNVDTVWQNNRMKNRFSSSVLRDGYIYGLDNAILACLDAATGELMWKGGPIRLRPAAARRRPSGDHHRARGPGACAGNAREPSGGSRLSGHRRQDLERAGTRGRAVAAPKRARDGRVRSAARRLGAFALPGRHGD